MSRRGRIVKAVETLICREVHSSATPFTSTAILRAPSRATAAGAAALAGSAALAFPAYCFTRTRDPSAAGAAASGFQQGSTSTGHSAVAPVRISSNQTPRCLLQHRGGLTVGVVQASWWRVAQRSLVLLCIIVPLLTAYPFTKLHPSVRRLWLAFLAQTLAWCGPAFTKWGQWAAGRPDLLSLDVRQVLETLHTDAPKHSQQQTLQALRRAMPTHVEELFDELNLEPHASGAIAQVHTGRLSAAGARLCGADTGQVRCSYLQVNRGNQLGVICRTSS